LAETTLRVKVNGKLGEIFQTLIGTPQGDALSCVLFIIYMEVILRTYVGIETYMKIGQNEQTLAYADDVQLYLRETRREITERTAMQQHVEGCPCINCRAEGLLRTTPAHFAEYNMKVNPEKTTDDVIATKICTLRIVLGSEIAGERELALRKRKSEAAYNAKINIWKHRHISEETKVKIFKTTVQCFYTQSGAAVVMKKQERDKMDTHQRSLLRRLLGIFYPDRIGNIELYERAHTIPVSVAIKHARWRFMGHILRLDQDIPLFKSMEEYFKSRQGFIPEPRREKTRRGRLVTTIARILDQDLKDFAHSAQQFGAKQLTEGSHLKLLRRSAQNKEHWAHATGMMQAADLKDWKIRENARSNTRKTRAQRAVQQPRAQPEQQPGLQAPIPVVLRRGGAAPRPRGRPPGSKNKPKGRSR
jgi:Reverse transcriptase (RNA-dependent DNA polymerase)